MKTFIEKVVGGMAKKENSKTLTISPDNFLEMIKWELRYSPVMREIPSISDIEKGRCDFIGLKLKLKKGKNILIVN